MSPALRFLGLAMVGWVGLLLVWAQIMWGGVLVVFWLLAVVSGLDLAVLFVGGAAMCWTGVGLGLWTALRWNNLVVSGAVIVSR